MLGLIPGTAAAFVISLLTGSLLYLFAKKNVLNIASAGQGALFEKTAPWTVKHPQKLLIKGCFNRHLSSDPLTH